MWWAWPRPRSPRDGAAFNPAGAAPVDQGLHAPEHAASPDHTRSPRFMAARGRTGMAPTTAEPASKASAWLLRALHAAHAAAHAVGGMEGPGGTPPCAHRNLLAQLGRTQAQLLAPHSQVDGGLVARGARSLSWSRRSSSRVASRTCSLPGLLPGRQRQHGTATEEQRLVNTPSAAGAANPSSTVRKMARKIGEADEHHRQRPHHRHAGQARQFVARLDRERLEANLRQFDDVGKQAAHARGGAARRQRAGS